MNEFPHCKNCGNLLPARVPGKRGRDAYYCNHWCGVLARGGKLPVDRVDACLQCDAPITQSPNGGQPRKYCSRKCASRFVQSLKPKKPFVNKPCAKCGVAFSTNRYTDRFCSSACRKLNASVRLKQKWIDLNPSPDNYNYDCDDCGRLVERAIEQGRLTKGRYGRFCKFCSLKRRRESYRHKTVKRQGVAKPAYVYFETVVERDGGICWLCNKAVDLTLSRITRYGATLDHVIPISKGGADSLDNIRLAHWICNNQKSNKMIEGLNA
jgi:hypothetical protein